jgi:hypothetical protein
MFGTWASSLAFRLLAVLREAAGASKHDPDRTRSPVATVPASMLKWTQVPNIPPSMCQPSCPDSLKPPSRIGSKCQTRCSVTPAIHSHYPTVARRLGQPGRRAPQSPTRPRILDGCPIQVQHQTRGPSKIGQDRRTKGRADTAPEQALNPALPDRR